LPFSTSVFVMRCVLSANACHTMMPASISSATSDSPCWSLQRCFRTSRKTNMYTHRLMTGKITDQKKPMLEPT
jgi:hypothetical protein